MDKKQKKIKLLTCSDEIRQENQQKNKIKKIISTLKQDLIKKRELP